MAYFFRWADNRNSLNTYDAAGNQTNDGLHNYSFNAENQITQMDAGTATYAYDGEGRRMKRLATVQGVTETTYYFYGPGGIISEFTTSNAIATATAASSTDKCFYHTTDKLGSAVLVIAANGTVIENNRTLPYGETWLAESTPSTNDKKFTTYQRDGESALDYAMHRFYGSTAGRFLSVDSADGDFSKPIALNRYDYLRLDPLNDTDPTGLEGQQPQPSTPSPLDQAPRFGIGEPAPFNVFLAIEVVGGAASLASNGSSDSASGEPTDDSDSQPPVDPSGTGLEGIVRQRLHPLDSLRPPPNLKELASKAATAKAAKEKVDEGIRAVKCVMQVPGGRPYNICMGDGGNGGPIPPRM